MKKLYIFLALSLSLAASAQCPNGNVELTTQAQVNAFASTYPNCTQINGILSIHGDNITDLTPLQNLTTVTGALQVYLNPSLTSLNGLQNITSTGGLEVSYNSTLTSVAGLSGVTTVNGYLGFTANPQLLTLEGLNIQAVGSLISISQFAGTNLHGLESISSGGFFLEVKFSPNLTSLDGLDGMTSLADYLYIYSNPVLSNIEGIANIDFNNFQPITIQNNPMLSQCSVASVCNHLTGGSAGTFGGNLPGCNGSQEIIAGCNLSTAGFQEAGISIYPNPTDGLLTVILPERQNLTGIRIADLSGKILISSASDNIDISSLATGIYILHATSGQAIFTSKIIRK